MSITADLLSRSQQLAIFDNPVHLKTFPMVQNPAMVEVSVSPSLIGIKAPKATCWHMIMIGVWARTWSLGDILSPWLKFWGTFLFLRGTDKLIFIQNFFYIHFIQANQQKHNTQINTQLIHKIINKVIQTRKAKLLVSNNFFLIIFKQRIVDVISCFIIMEC